MKRRFLHLSVSIFLVTLVSAGITGGLVDDPAVADPEGQPASVGEADRSGAVSLAAMTDTQAEKLTPLHREMREILLRDRAEVAVLTARLTAGKDRLAGLELQREISDRKFRTQIELLEVQGRYARKEGRIQQAEEAERAVTRWNARLETRQADRRQQ